ncbi:MAG: HAD family hydrolase, partial [Paramuribaculum sp.]|nr:HAD family hydrolase [Paramuribaculum sp.]
VFESTILILAMGNVDKVFMLAEMLDITTGLSISAYRDSYNRSTGLIEILGENVSKASAVAQLKSITGANHLTVFGDNLNDLPMMAIADVSVATANAVEQVKEAADIVIGSNNDDSVAKFIRDSLS